jgi:hypothetical protein
MLSTFWRIPFLTNTRLESESVVQSNGRFDIVYHLSLFFSLILSHTHSHALPLSLYFCSTSHSHSFLDQNTLSLSLTLYLLKTTLTLSFLPKNWGWPQIENSIVKQIYSTDFSRRINLHRCT